MTPPLNTADMTRERDDTGQYVETVAPDSVLDVLNHVNGPVITSSDVADYLDCTTEAARQKLRKLVERDDLDRRKTGRTVVYWRPERETFDDADLRGDPDTTLADPNGESATTTAEENDDTPASARDDESGGTRDESDPLVDEVRAYLERADVSPKTAHGRDAVIDVFRHLRQHGTTSTGDLQDAVYEGYTDEWDSQRSMWESIRRGFDDVPGIEDAGYGKYGYAGDESVRDQLNGEQGGIYDPTKEFDG